MKKPTNKEQGKGQRQTVEKPKPEPMSPVSILHLMGLQVAGGSALLLPLIRLLIEQVVAFYLELYLCPAKIDLICERLREYGDPLHPGSPVQEFLRALEEIKRLIAEAREAIARGDAKTAKEKISEANDKANNPPFPPRPPGGFPAPMPTPDAGQSPVSAEEMENVRLELNFMLSFISICVR